MPQSRSQPQSSCEQTGTGDRGQQRGQVGTADPHEDKWMKLSSSGASGTGRAYRVYAPGTGGKREQNRGVGMTGWMVCLCGKRMACQSTATLRSLVGSESG